MNTKLVNSVAGVVLAAMEQDRTAAGIALALESAQLLMSPETAAELVGLRARLADVHRMPQDNLTPAEVRLAQYGERTKTWSTATHDSGAAKALYEIACALRDTLEETRDQRNAARLKVMGLESRVTELLTERHSTNEALDDAAKALREQRDRIAELERLIAEAPTSYVLMDRARAAASAVDGGCPRNVIDGDVGGHFFKVGAIAEGPRHCMYCGAAETGGAQ